MITKLHLKDFTLFSEAEINFGSLNVIHGENSSGKTHLLKLCYAIASTLAPGPTSGAPALPTKGWLEGNLGTKIGAVFRPDQNKIGRLARRAQGSKRAMVNVELGILEQLDLFSPRKILSRTLRFSFGTRSNRSVAIDKIPSVWLDQPPIFIPTRELLSVYPGFVSLYETQAIPFDETWRDTCLLLGAPIARGAKKHEITHLLKPLEEAIGCKALLEGDRFFLQMKEPKAKIEADLVAEGYRKLSMVARLIANGSISSRGYLFWDEPEANLNARLVRELAPLLLDLASSGVQVFIATHSLFLMRELAILQALRASQEREGRQDNVRYIGLHPGSNGVSIQQGDTIEESGDIVALDENLDQSDRYFCMEDS